MPWLLLTSAGWVVTRKSLSTAWALLVIHIPFPWVYRYWRKCKNIFSHLHTTYIYKNTHTDTHTVSLEAIKTDKPFSALLQSLLELHWSYTQKGPLLTVETSIQAHHQPSKIQAGNKPGALLQNAKNNQNTGWSQAAPREVLIRHHEKLLQGKGCQALARAAQGRAGFTIPGSVKKMLRCGTWGHSLVVVLVWQLDLTWCFPILTILCFSELKEKNKAIQALEKNI